MKNSESKSNLVKAANIGYGIYHGLSSMFRAENGMDREMLIYRTTEMI